MAREVHFAVEKVRGLGEGFGYVGEHVRHGFVDAGPVGAAVEPVAALGESR